MPAVRSLRFNCPVADGDLRDYHQEFLRLSTYLAYAVEMVCYGHGGAGICVRWQLSFT